MNKPRLLRLAAFLDELPRSKFDITHLATKTSCGTVACAIGWTPKLWPRIVKWLPSSIDPSVLHVVIVGRAYTDWLDTASYLFGIRWHEALHLFIYTETAEPWNRKPITPEATPKQVAASIRRFVAWKEKQP